MHACPVGLGVAMILETKFDGEKRSFFFFSFGSRGNLASTPRVVVTDFSGLFFFFFLLRGSLKREGKG